MKRLLVPLLIFAIAVFLSVITPTSNADASQNDMNAVAISEVTPAPDISSPAAAVESRPSIIYSVVAVQAGHSNNAQSTPESEVVLAEKGHRRAIKHSLGVVARIAPTRLSLFRT